MASFLVSPGKRVSGDTPALPPALGADTDSVLRDVLNLLDSEIKELRENGALG